MYHKLHNRFAVNKWSMIRWRYNNIVVQHKLKRIFKFPWNVLLIAGIKGVEIDFFFTFSNTVLIEWIPWTKKHLWLKKQVCQMKDFFVRARTFNPFASRVQNLYRILNGAQNCTNFSTFSTFSSFFLCFFSYLFKF